MKIRKAIKVCRKLAKAGLSDAAPTQRNALRAVKSLTEKFEAELIVRSETTSLRQAAAAIAGVGRLRRDAAEQLERLAIVRALAWNIRAVGARVVNTRPRAASAGKTLRLA
jgi:hypothetical protein